MTTFVPQLSWKTALPPYYYARAGLLGREEAEKGWRGGEGRGGEGRGGRGAETQGLGLHVRVRVRL